MKNILNIDNWIIVGLGLLKMLYYFWPIVVLAICFMIWEHIKETKHTTIN